MSGDISLDLFAPLEVRTETTFGEVDVRVMLANGRSRYSPPNENSLGNLDLTTMSGNITLRYYQ
ncbi:hypothetical protein AUJ84_02420 [Candidatus Pacearchaeota archaeon CG1_02_32_132]|nr:MAG: hypothetical protein AUJ84_02420 [Candidatus Pacearchaeota archaeon CG1_02_32_132]